MLEFERGNDLTRLIESENLSNYQADSSTVGNTNKIAYGCSLGDRRHILVSMGSMFLYALTTAADARNP